MTHLSDLEVKVMGHSTSQASYAVLRQLLYKKKGYQTFLLFLTNQCLNPVINDLGQLTLQNVIVIVFY